MKQMKPEDIRSLVTKAFVLEAITDKPGCTTRYEDLPGKPLQDFIIAGINAADSFSDLTKDWDENDKPEVFAHNPQALLRSNLHKSPKYVNFGLLEIMFPTVVARLKTDNPKQVVVEIIEVVQKTNNQDVKHLLEARKIAWSTSQTSHKIGFSPEKYQGCSSVWDFYERFFDDFPVESSNHQWALQYKKGLPILSAFFEGYQEAGEVMQSTKGIFLKQKAENPAVAVGIIADMCAAAIFLWLSFHDTTA